MRNYLDVQSIPDEFSLRVRVFPYQNKGIEYEGGAADITGIKVYEVLKPDVSFSRFLVKIPDETKFVITFGAPLWTKPCPVL